MSRKGAGVDVRKNKDLVKSGAEAVLRHAKKYKGFLDMNVAYLQGMTRLFQLPEVNLILYSAPRISHLSG